MNSWMHVLVSKMMFTAAVVLVTAVCQAAVLDQAVVWLIESEVILIIKSVFVLT